MNRSAVALALLLLLPLVACGDGDDGVSPDGSDGSNDPAGEQDPGGDDGDGGGGDTWLLRFDGADSEAMEAVLLASDGTYLVAGTTLSAGSGGGDVWLVKVAADGAVEWQTAYGGAGLEAGYDVVETADGGYVVAGATESFAEGASDMWVIKVDGGGRLLWQHSYGGAGLEQAWSVDETSDGGFVVAGGTTSFGAGGSDLLVLKLDASGQLEWQRAFGGPADDAPGGEYEEHVARVFEAGDGNLVASTVTFSFGSGDSDVWVLELDPEGDVLWQNAYGDEDEDGMWMARETADGDYLVSGYFTPTTDYDTDSWALRLAGDGSVAWQGTYGIEGVYDESLAVGATADGGALLGGSYYEAGDADWSWTLTRIGPSGGLDWSRRYERGFDWPNAIVELPAGGFVVAGVTMSSLADQEDLWLMKTAVDGSIGSSCAVVQDLSVSAAATVVEPVPTTATVTGPGITARTTSAVAVDTDIGSVFDCGG